MARAPRCADSAALCSHARRAFYVGALEDQAAHIPEAALRDARAHHLHCLELIDRRLARYEPADWERIGWSDAIICGAAFLGAIVWLAGIAWCGQWVWGLFD